MRQRAPIAPLAFEEEAGLYDEKFRHRHIRGLWEEAPSQSLKMEA
jgi:hypothetical protein